MSRRFSADATISRKRGDTFWLEFDLKNDDGSPSAWVPNDFTGGVFFTVRRELPESSVLDDADVLCQVSTTPSAEGSITWSSTVVGSDTFWRGLIEIQADVTREWPLTSLLAEIRGVVDGDPAVVPPINRADIRIVMDGDLKRSAY